MTNWLMIFLTLIIALFTYLVWKHIVNLTRIHAFNAVNLKRGYPLLEIRTPREIIEDD